MGNCTILVVDCNSTEGRRINATCNNLNYPAAGAAHTPLLRWLPAEYNQTAEDVFDPRLSKAGNALPPCRAVRQAFLSDGSVSDQNITSLATHLMVGFFTDFTTTSDTSNYVYWRTTCCTAAGKNEPMCYPLTVADDDRTHRFNNIRCLNMTRPQTYATSGCCPSTITPLRMVGATSQMDVSYVYGNVEDARRSYTGGNLSVEYVNGRAFPDTSKEKAFSEGSYANCTTFADNYNETLRPGVHLEFMAAMRVLHLMQDSIIRLYDTDGNYVKSYPATNLTTGISYVKESDNIIYFIQSSIRQPCAKIKDDICDSDLTNVGLGALQVSNDILSNDLCKTRLQGIPSYVKLRKLLFGDSISSFDDLQGITTPEGIEKMQEVYEDVEDVDALVGIWTEIFEDDVFVWPSLAKLIKWELLYQSKSDRFFFERPNRPNAFTTDQLAEIRKATAARLMCDIGDSVTEVQPSAFEVISDCNPLTSCDDIPAIDYSVWT
ncbi:hypothetical protein K1T71_004256 [Dendrolimus kikuchii]|uniref:Uncharacterized protein n=1 Tax=Dendrolimus kikuchii TaxID=765133 RepID=A0ACC1D767_9NEOP|nr:hypothetical protein K1T71_004256 [Dendrolimus kikuchii]